MEKREVYINPGFVHLRIHSAYSLLEGALKIDKIVEYACKDREPALAITDTNNLFGALEFSQKCLKAGVQPIIGCQLSIDFLDNDENLLLRTGKTRTITNLPSLVFLAATDEGHAKLVHLVSRAYLEKKDTDPPHIQISWLEEYGEGLIVLSGWKGGPVDQALTLDRYERAEQRLTVLQKIFPEKLYIELQRHGHYDAVHEQKLLSLAYKKSVPLVATNEAFFLKPEDYAAHDVLLAIAEGKILSVDERRRVTPDHYLKSRKDMKKIFSDLPEALSNTVEIARRCHTCTITRKPILPRFISNKKKVDSLATILVQESEEMTKQAREGLNFRLKTVGIAGSYTKEEYEERLEYEISVIIRMQFSGYFLIVSDFIKWAKAQGIAVGPGRGSGAGSLVAYALMITDIDPLRFSLLFERFLNPDRISMPDFDIDFCQERREEIIHYVQDKYGKNQVAQIITFGTLQARAALRDVGRVLEMPYGQVDRLSKLIPFNPANPISLTKAVAEEPKFEEEKQKDPIVGRLIDIARRLEGLYRHASTHAAGIVIGDRPLWQLVPLYRDPRSDMPVTQFNMKYVEQAGLVKFDFLGLKTLTVLQTSINFIARKGVKINFSTLPLDDAKTYTMMARGETIGVFQVESAGMRKALLGMKPDRIEDIIALVALYRPGPMENISTYNARKHGEEKIASIHPKIDPLVKETQGVIVYQEQVMQIAQVLSGYSLGEADLLRRAMGKKIREEMDKQRTRFVEGALKRGVSYKQANTIFDLLAKFADYGFNKSHAAAYALISYQTAYIKAHHPVEFLASSMTYDLSNIDKLNDFRQEAEKLGIKIIPPSIQTSSRIFEPGKNRIFYSLAAIKGVGEQAVEHIVERRGDILFLNLEDFCKRIDTHIVSRRVLESLINAGALDCFSFTRESLVAGIDTILAHSQRLTENHNSGQIDIFGETVGIEEPLILPPMPAWSTSEKLHREFQSVGFYLSAHPLDEYKSLLQKSQVQQWRHFIHAVHQGASIGRLAGTVNGKQIRKMRSGSKMGVIQLSDASGQYEVVLFSEALSRYAELLELGSSVIVNVNAANRPEGVSLRVLNMCSLSDITNQLQKMIRISLNSSKSVSYIASLFKEKGESEVSIVLHKAQDKTEIEILLAERYRITPQHVSVIQNIQGVIDVELL